MGLWDNVKTISGCSIGAINAVAMAQYDPSSCYDLWQEIAKREIFKGVDQNSDNYYLQLAKESIFNDGVDITPFRSIFEEKIDADIVSKQDKEIVLTAFNMSQRQQEYKAVNDLPKKQLIDFMMASSRLPFFQPVFINENKYADGGLGDNNPVHSTLENKHFDVHINFKIMHIPYYFPGLREMNITAESEYILSPSESLGNPISFTSPSFDEKFEMGYNDAMKLLSNIK